jgi:peroxiredoxin Q/BCP
LRQDYERFVERGARLLVVGPEGPDKFREYWEENDLPFTGLPDPRHSVLKRYGQEINLFKLGRMPAQIIIDRRGRVRYVHYGKSMSDIPENEELLELLDQLVEEEQSDKISA